MTYVCCWRKLAVVAFYRDSRNITFREIWLGFYGSPFQYFMEPHYSNGIFGHPKHLQSIDYKEPYYIEKVKL